MFALLIRHPGHVRKNRSANTALPPIAILGCCLMTIISVSALDIWFAVENKTIMIVEQNPICLALMELDPGGFRYFIAGKATGTTLVVLVLAMLHRRQYRHAMKVTYGVTAFQIGLLIYLTLSDPSMHNLPNFKLLFADQGVSIWNID